MLHPDIAQTKDQEMTVDTSGTASAMMLTTGSSGATVTTSSEATVAAHLNYDTGIASDSLEAILEKQL